MLPGSRQFRTLTAAILAGVVALALVNPFCCHLLPLFEAEPPPGEAVFDEAASPCPGKPEAVTETGAVLPDFAGLTIDRIVPLPTMAPGRTIAWVRDRAWERPGPPCRILFGGFLI